MRARAWCDPGATRVERITQRRVFGPVEREARQAVVDKVDAGGSTMETSVTEGELARVCYKGVDAGGAQFARCKMEFEPEELRVRQVIDDSNSREISPARQRPLVSHLADEKVGPLAERV